MASSAIIIIPSEDQERVHDFVRRGTGNGVVSAVAGGGKTHTLLEVAKILMESESFAKMSIIFVAFNSHIVKELNARLAGTGIAAKTINQVGTRAVLSTLGKVADMESAESKKKYDRLAAKWVDQNGGQFAPDERKEIAASLTKMVNMARMTLVNTSSFEALNEMRFHFNIEVNYPSFVFPAVPVILQQGQDVARNKKVIDFTDQIWLPIVWNLPLQKYNFVLADEQQDLSRCQLEIVKKIVAPSGRFLGVGDRRQSIMAFSGADSRSFDNIKEGMNAVELPLSICYRCPTSHLRLAQMIVPEIQPRPNAPEGEIVHIKPTDDLSKYVKGGDLVICRLTAPLVAECIRLIRNRVSAKVRGRNIGYELTALLKQIGETEGFSYANVVQHLREYKERRVEFLRQKDADESAIESLCDRVECLQVCAESYLNATTISELSDEINKLFDDNRPSVWLSTIHRAKGLEADRVFILKPEKLPLRWKGQQAWEFEQEMNLLYVALTRAKQVLYCIGDLPEPCQTREEIKPETEALEASLDATEEALPLETAELVPFLVDYGCRACGGALESLIEQDEGICDSCQSWKFNHAPVATGEAIVTGIASGIDRNVDTSNLMALTLMAELGEAISNLDALVHDHNAMYMQDKIREAVEKLTKLWNETKNPVEDHEEERQKEETEERTQEQAWMAMVDGHERIATEEEEAITRERDRDYIAFVQRAGKPDHCPLCGAWLQEEDEFIYCPTHGGPYTLLQEQSIKQQEEWNNAHPF